MKTMTTKTMKMTKMLERQTSDSSPEFLKPQWVITASPPPYSHADSSSQTSSSSSPSSSSSSPADNEEEREVEEESVKYSEQVGGVTDVIEEPEASSRLRNDSSTSANSTADSGIEEGGRKSPPTSVPLTMSESSMKNTIMSTTH